MVTQDRLKEMLHYDPGTGAFTWRVKTRRAQQKIGDRAGYLDPAGYWTIRVDGNLYRASRLAWLYMTGAWPADLIDHKNRDRGDDRWANLRSATYSQNNRNVTAYGKTGVLGVCQDAKGFYGLVMHEGKRHYAGRFKTLGAAAQATNKLREHLHQDFAAKGGV